MNKFNQQKEYDKMCESVKKLIDATEIKMAKMIENYNKKSLSWGETIFEVETDALSNMFNKLNDYVNNHTDHVDGYGSYFNYQPPSSPWSQEIL